MKKKLFFAAVTALFVLLAGTSSASAGGCPTKPVAEEGGTHSCFKAGHKGNVHLWKPSGYDRGTAVTVIYVHGYNGGADPCATSTDDVDCVWEKHRLASQFGKSGLNALFVAVEGPISDREKPRWNSLDALLDAIKAKGGISPPMPVVAAGHSGGIFTIVKWLGDGRLKHVIALDAGYADAPRKIAKWYAASKGRRLTLIGAEGTYWSTAALGKKLRCDRDDDFSDPYSATQKSERCLTMIDSGIIHMDVVLAGKVMPLSLSRIVQPPPPRQKPKPHRKPHRRKRR